MLNFDIRNWDDLCNKALSFTENILDISYPQVHTVNKPDEFVAYVAVPGFNKSELTLTVQGGGLVLRGVKSKKSENCYSRDFTILVHIPSQYDKEGATAVAEDGVCVITAQLKKVAPQTINIS